MMENKMSLRRKAREVALQMLFQWDSIHDMPVAKPFVVDFFQKQSSPPKVKEFAMVLVEGVIKHCSQIDQIIRKNTEHWSLGRMAIIDRNILRFSVFELLYLDDIPAKVTLNEAIEVAKKFGSEESSRFVNGVLDKVLQENECLSKKNEVVS